MKHTLLTIFVVGYLGAATVPTVYCQGTFYTSRSAFQSTLITTTTISFENIPVTQEGPGEFSIATSGVTFIGTYMYIRGSFAPIPATGNYLRQFDALGPVHIFLPNGVTAFGADFSGGIGSNPSFNATLTANLVGGQTYAYNFSGTQGFWTFFGVSFPQPIASLIFNDVPNFPFPWHEEMLDNVTFGTVPEPSVFSLIGLGVLFLGWRRFNKSQS